MRVIELKWTEIEFGEFQVHPASMGKSQIRFFFVRSREERRRIFIKNRFRIYVACASCSVEL